MLTIAFSYRPFGARSENSLIASVAYTGTAPRMIQNQSLHDPAPSPIEIQFSHDLGGPLL